MVDYSKWDKLELSDDSDIEVHPNVDKRSFIRAKQNQIHAERQARKHHIEALRYERVINGTLVQRLSTLLSSLRAHTEECRHSDPASVAFQVLLETAPRNPDEDKPPPRPEGVSDDGESLPTYTEMTARILDDVNKRIDGRDLGHDQRYCAVVEEIGIHLEKLQELLEQSAKKLTDLEKEDATKITSGSYQTGFDSSHVNKARSNEDTTSTSKLELLNPNCDLNRPITDATSDVVANAPHDDDDGGARASPAAKQFAKIQPSDYRASREYISTHPEILEESETDGLLIEAFNAAIESNGASTWQHVHQAMLLQWCRMLGRDGINMFFKRISTPGHQARKVFEDEVTEKFKRIRALAEKQRTAERDAAVERIQIQTVEPGTAIHIQVPEVNSGDEEVRRSRAIFEEFPPEIKSALESGLLDNVNEVLGTLDVVEAENLVSLFGDAGCLNIEKDVIDTTTDEGKRRLQEMEEAAVAHAEAGDSKIE